MEGEDWHVEQFSNLHKHTVVHAYPHMYTHICLHVMHIHKHKNKEFKWVKYVEYFYVHLWFTFLTQIIAAFGFIIWILNSAWKSVY